MSREWARTALVLAAILLVLLAAMAVQSAKGRAHQLPNRPSAEHR